MKGGFRDIKKLPKKNEKSKNKNFEPVSECQKAWKGRPFGLFQTSVCCKISKKNLKGDPLQKKNSQKKVAQCRKRLKGDPIFSSGFVSYDKNGVIENGDPLHYLKCAPRSFAGPVV